MKVSDFTSSKFIDNIPAGYESPITMIMHEVETKIENDCVMAVQKYGFDVDADELWKALKYDRQQYLKGYEDARRCYERPHGKWLTDERGYVCSECGALHRDDYPFCHMCGAEMYMGVEE